MKSSEAFLKYQDSQRENSSSCLEVVSCLAEQPEGTVQVVLVAHVGVPWHCHTVVTPLLYWLLRHLHQRAEQLQKHLTWVLTDQLYFFASVLNMFHILCVAALFPSLIFAQRQRAGAELAPSRCVLSRICWWSLPWQHHSFLQSLAWQLNPQIATF